MKDNNMALAFLDKAFCEEDFTAFVSEAFEDFEHKETRYTNSKLSDNDKNHITEYKYLGEAFLEDNSEIGILILKSATPNIAHKRVGFSDVIFKLSKDHRKETIWVAIYHEDSSIWRLTFVSYDFKGGKQIQNTDSKRYSYELGLDIATKTAKAQIGILLSSEKLTQKILEEVFSVEKVSKAFFEKYKEHYFETLEYLRPQMAVFGDEKGLSLFTKKLLGRITFLYFLQKKGWLGSQKIWGNGDKKFLSHQLENFEGENFYDQILKPLFFEALNTNREEKRHLFKDFGMMPYLNGGLFSPQAIDQDERLVLEDSVFHKIIQTFSEYNFTIIEHTLHESEVAIDPEMLGRVFEDLLEDRKAKGAFYTPREIVHYMCQTSLTNYLKNKPTDQSPLEYIKKIKILDPAIGSGAFPMGMLHEILEKRLSLGDKEEIANIKRDIIEKSIYGIDIEPSAVEIAKLRFWLSIVVDEQTPSPLPNLFYKIMVGNSLLETINGFDPLEKDKDNLFDTEDTLIDDIQALLARFYHTHEHKKALQEEIDHKIDAILNKKLDKHQDELRSQVNNASILGFDKKKTQMVERLSENITLTKAIKQRPTTELFFYKIYFAEVMRQGGFDIVIGNPPYVRHEKIKAIKERLKIEGYQSYNGTADLYIYFFEQGYNLLKENGILSYITSSKYTRAKYGKEFRKFILENTNIIEYIDFNGVKVFESATVDTSIFTYQKSKEKNSSFNYCAINEKYKKGNDLENFIVKNRFDYLQSDLSIDSFSFLNKEELAIKKRIEQIGTPLKKWDIEINRGVTTGLNQVFVIDTKTKDELIAKESKSNEIIKPILRGRDIDKYSYKFANKWIITTFPAKNINIDNYLIVEEYLSRFGTRLEQSGIKGSRKKTNNKWFEIQDATSYYSEFEKEKIIWLQLTDENKFTIDKTSSFLLDSSYFITSKNDLKYILSLLNSKTIKFYFHIIADSSGVGTKKWNKQKTELIPIPKISKEAQKPFEILVDYVIFAKENEMNLEASLFESVINGLVYDLYFEEEMKRFDCFISDELSNILEVFDKSFEQVSKMYKIFKNNKTIQRGLIYRRVIPVVEIINGAKK